MTYGKLRKNYRLNDSILVFCHKFYAYLFTYLIYFLQIEFYFLYELIQYLDIIETFYLSLGMLAFYNVFAEIYSGFCKYLIR